MSTRKISYQEYTHLDCLNSYFSLQREEAEREQKKEDEFTQLAQNLHHLVSTKRIPGIYKPLPYYNNVRGVVFFVYLVYCSLFFLSWEEFLECGCIS